MSTEFELEVMTSAHRDAIASLVASCKDTARYQHRAEKAEATLARVEELAQSWRVGRGSASWIVLRAVLAAKS